MARKRYPSDHRRYFRLESTELPDSTAELTDAEFRAFVLILAWANETKAQERDDWVAVARNRLPGVAPNRRGSVASSARVVRELCAKQSWELREGDVRWEIRVRDWSEYQGFTPARLRPDSASRASDPTPTPTPTPIKKESAASAASISDPAPEGNRKPKKAQRVPFPEPLPAEDRARLLRLAAGAGFSESQCDQAIPIYGDWAKTGDHRRADHVRGILGGMRRGWALNQKPGSGPPPKQEATRREYLEFDSPEWNKAHGYEP